MNIYMMRRLDTKTDVSIVEEVKEDSGIVTEERDNKVRVKIWENEYIFDLESPASEYDMLKSTTEFDIPIEILSEGFDVYIDGEKISTQSFEYRIPEISKNKRLEFKFVDTTTNEIFYQYVNTYPRSAPKFRSVASGAEDGYYYFSVENYLYKLSSSGEIVFYWNLDKYCLDFKLNETEDGDFYSFFVANYDDYAIESDYVPSRAVIMDDKYGVVDEIDYMIKSDSVDYDCVLDSHELVVLGKNHYIVEGYVGKMVDNIPDTCAHTKGQTRVAASIIQEINDGKLVWEWDSTEHPELYELSVFQDYLNQEKEWFDYMHLNSIEIDPTDDSMLCSFRNLCAVVKIDRSSGDISWILGGKGDQFGLSEDQKMSLQHFARKVGKNGLSVFDNGAASDTDGFNMDVGETRIVEYYLDESKKVLVDFKEYKIDGQYSYIMGSAQNKGNERYVIGWGGRKTANAVVSEVDFKSGNTLFGVYYPRNGFTGDSYRSYKFNK